MSAAVYLETTYLVDSNSLRDLGVARRATTFFRSRCRLPEDVLHEARYHSDIASLQPLNMPVTPQVLRHLRKIMAAVPVGSTDLLDLYHNQGAADPLLIATALAECDADANTLLPNCWVVVTNDKAVLALATEFKIPTLSPTTLAELIDEAKSS